MMALNATPLSTSTKCQQTHNFRIYLRLCFRIVRPIKPSGDNIYPDLLALPSTVSSSSLTTVCKTRKVSSMNHVFNTYDVVTSSPPVPGHPKQGAAQGKT